MDGEGKDVEGDNVLTWRGDGGGVWRQWKRIRENIGEKYSYTCQQAAQDISNM